MWTKKKQAVSGFGLAVVVGAALLTGCSPSGPDALLDGKRLLDHGQPDRAVRSLRDATSLMPTNAMAWGYLGLAYQQGGFTTNAVEAYAQALALSPDLAEVRFNLGCLWLGEGQWAQAREQFAAATLLNRSFAIAWQHLGEAQVHLGEDAAAVQSLGESLRLNPVSPDAWNWLGVAQLKQGRTQEALRSFRSALRIQTNHGPALLNLAILHQTKLKDPEAALKLYRQYLAYLHTAMNVGDVRRTIDELEAGLPAQGQPDPAVPVLAATPAATVDTESSGLTARPVTRTNTVTRPEPVQRPVQPVEVVAATPNEVPKMPPTETIVVKPLAPIASAAPSPPIDPKRSASAAGTEEGVTVPSSNPDPRVIQSADEELPGKRGFFARVNPLNLFKKKSRKKEPTPLPPRNGGEVQGAVETEAASRQAQPAGESNTPAATRLDVKNPAQYKRYGYRSVTPVPAEDAPGAMRAFDKAEKLRLRGKSAEAIQGYLKVVQADPSSFAAHFNLGLLYLQRRELSSALESFEMATKVQPTSAPARYNFALTLKLADFPVDAAGELLTLLSQHPDDVRAHLMLGNLYAQQFREKEKARVEYQRVLKLSPGHPQAASIHLWLVQNPL